MGGILRTARSCRGPLWVKLGSDPASLASQFYPQEQTSSDHPGMSEKCSQQAVIRSRHQRERLMPMEFPGQVPWQP